MGRSQFIAILLVQYIFLSTKTHLLYPYPHTTQVYFHILFSHSPQQYRYTNTISSLTISISPFCITVLFLTAYIHHCRTQQYFHYGPATELAHSPAHCLALRFSRVRWQPRMTRLCPSLTRRRSPLSWMEHSLEYMPLRSEDFWMLPLISLQCLRSIQLGFLYQYVSFF